ncbi:AT-rich interactive domain-containing protein 1B [Drosophila elegans]|uniref:AT-rich interactive domain-containing protein 1B n=1 Tax=Drosophila elegans TaxID=30023 RepID=UPI0007E66152|nr:AT-rich interactive domain-containing protein 1B [Drosophila elegans]
MLCQRPIHCHLFLLQLLAIPYLLLGSPVSSPEITGKSSKSANSLQQQQQQQLQQQEAHLNSLSAYASGYDMVQQQNLAPNQLQQNQVLSAPTDPAFKPSYKMPEMETNFTPMQTGGTPSVASLPSTPMLMQYLPAQTIQDGSGNAVQYLQLIPTRPIIVPISPYLSAAAAAAGSPAGISAGGQPDFGGRTAAVLSALQQPNYGALQGYAAATGGSINPVAGFRNSYRINREAKDKHYPPTFSLNLNEYFPASTMALSGGHEATTGNGHHLYLRARP